MEKEDILVMKPGDYLDKLVAKDVMGLVPCSEWNQINFGSAGGPALEKRCSHKEGECYPSQIIGSMAGRVGGCPRYSTDILAAWRVVEKLREEGYSLHIEYYSPKVDWAPKDRRTQVLFTNRQGIFQDDVKGDLTVPEAISKAALLAKI